jgi:hypothetical protein
MLCVGFRPIMKLNFSLGKSKTLVLFFLPIYTQLHEIEKREKFEQKTKKESLEHFATNNSTYCFARESFIFIRFRFARTELPK